MNPHTSVLYSLPSPWPRHLSPALYTGSNSARLIFVPCACTFYIQTGDFLRRWSLLPSIRRSLFHHPVVTIMTSQPRPQDSQGLAQRRKQGFFSPELAELIFPPFKVGFWAGMWSWRQTRREDANSSGSTGTAGVLAGVGGAIARETNPILSGSVTGIQWFTLGTTFWCRYHIPSSLGHLLTEAQSQGLSRCGHGATRK